MGKPKHPPGLVVNVLVFMLLYCWRFNIIMLEAVKPVK